MDTTSLIEIIILIVVAYLIIRFVVSPVIKAILGVIVVLVAIYLSQRLFGFDLNKILSPFGITLDFDKLSSSFGWILGPANYYIDQAKNFLGGLWNNIPKGSKP